MPYHDGNSICNDLEAEKQPSRVGSIVQAADGFDLWYEVMGNGPTIIFVSRVPDEHRWLAQRLSRFYRVVLYEPRIMTMCDIPERSPRQQKKWLDNYVVVSEFTMEQKKEWVKSKSYLDLWMRPPGHLSMRNLSWDPSQYENGVCPLELDVADIHTVTSTVGIDKFVLAGYSYTASYAAFLTPYSNQTVGLIAGGFPLLNSYDYWQGHAEGRRSYLLEAGQSMAATICRIISNCYTMMNERGEKALYQNMTGPKIVWFGSQDGEPGCWVYENLIGARIAKRIRKQRSNLEQIGFKVIELEGFNHGECVLAAEQVAVCIKQALDEAGYK